MLPGNYIERCESMPGNCLLAVSCVREARMLLNTCDMWQLVIRDCPAQNVGDTETKTCFTQDTSA